MEKTFVLRTSVIVSSHNPTLRFGNDNTIVVPMPVLEAVYQYKGRPEKKIMAAKFIEYINSIPLSELMSEKGYQQSNGSYLRVVESDFPFDEKIDNMQGLSLLDKRVFQICLQLRQEKTIVLISQSPVIRMKARKFLGISAQPFKDELFPDPKDQYKGYSLVSVSQTNLDKFFSGGELPIKDVYEYQAINWQENMFTVIQSESASGVGRYTNGKIVKLKYTLPNGYKALNVEQKMLWECLLAPPEDAPLIVVKGAAGTGKTYCSLAMALERLAKYSSKDDGIYDQILVASPTVTVSNESIGYLPGDIDDKVGPYLGGIMDNLKSIFREKSPGDDNGMLLDKANELFDRGFIQIQPIGFLRGRTIPNTVFIVDETQNISPSDIKDIVTRAAKGSKFIFLGDPEQINNPDLNMRYNGLVYLSEKMKGNSLCWQVTLNSDKSVRSDLAQEALKIL